jgi:cobalamin synthase
LAYYALKILVSAVLVAAISEVGKRSGFWGAILASLPVTSILAMIWLYRDTKDVQRISQLSTGIFWLVLPSLVLFIALPLLLKAGWSFYPSLLSAMALTVAAYFGMAFVLKGFGVQI